MGCAWQGSGSEVQGVQWAHLGADRAQHMLLCAPGGRLRRVGPGRGTVAVRAAEELVRRRRRQAAQQRAKAFAPCGAPALRDWQLVLLAGRASAGGFPCDLQPETRVGHGASH